MFFSVFAVSAFAEPAVTTVTLGKGETVFGICQKYGVDYNTYKNLMMALNGVTDEGQFGKMPAGSKIAVPVSQAAAAAISGCGSSGSGSAGTAKPSAKPGKPAVPKKPVGVAGTVPFTDSISYYLVPYTIQPGDTISGIYERYDLSYKTYSALIMKLNNLSGFNKLKAGMKLLLPAPGVTDASLVSYTVMAHTMKPGETVYSIVHSGYDMNFNDNQAMLKTVNGRDKLDSFRVGEQLFIAVSGFISPADKPAA